MAVMDRLRAVQLKANLIADEVVGLMEINVDVHDGIATLTGEVETDAQRAIAEELAYEVDGIYEVDNRLLVAAPSPDSLLPGEDGSAHMGYSLSEGDVGSTAFAIGGEYVPGPAVPTSEQFPGEFTDHEIECEVMRKLAAQREVEVTGLEVRSERQIVHLKGYVKTSDDLNRLLDLALSARGVMGVSSDIVVQEGESGTPVE